MRKDKKHILRKLDSLNIWRQIQYRKKNINVSNYLTLNQLEILRKLEIFIIENKLYTTIQFYKMYIKLMFYYKDSSKEDSFSIRDLSKTGVSKEDYNAILAIFHQIIKDYEL